MIPDDGGMTAALLVFVGLLGLVIGSFLNVVVWRLPRGESLAAPPSACPRCGHAIRPRDNIPMLSWLILRGKCRDCVDAISARYPLVELGTALAFVAVALRFGLTGPAAWALPGYLYLAAIAVALALIDLDTRTLPNRIVLPSYVVGIVGLTVASWGSGDWSALLRAAMGGAILWVAYLAMAFSYPNGMGFGDVKLAGVLGLYLGWIGWGALAIGAFAAFLLGGIFAIGLVVTRRAGRKSGIPFGPWMLIGAWVGIVAGEPLWAAYLGSIG